MVLAQDEIDACREAFLAFDKDRCVLLLLHKELLVRVVVMMQSWSLNMVSGGNLVAGVCAGAGRSTCGSCARSWKVLHAR